MLLSEIFDQLAYGEFSQLQLGGANSGTIDIDSYPRLITLINNGALALHTLFPLKYDRAIIDLYEHITRYQLHYDYALSNVASNQAYKYINDLGGNNFVNNIILITDVKNEEGVSLSLNTPQDINSLYTPEPNVVQVPYPIEGNSIEVIYRASPTRNRSYLSSFSDKNIFRYY